MTDNQQPRLHLLRFGINIGSEMGIIATECH
jgi:hypothetical protein